MTRNGDGTYSCMGNYSGSKSYDHTRGNQNFGSGTNATATIEGATPSEDDLCVFTLDTATNALTIRKANTVSTTNYIYFDNTESNWSETYKYFVVGRPKYSDNAYGQVNALTQVANTNLWRCSVGAWTDAAYYAVIASTSAWSSNPWDCDNIMAAAEYSSPYTTPLNIEGGKYYIVSKTNAANGTGVSFTKYSSYNDMKVSQTVEYKLSTDNGSTYATMTTGNTPGNLKQKYRNGWSSATGVGSETTNELKENKTTYSKSQNVPYRSVVILQESSTQTGYTFDGWFDGDTKLTKDDYTYYPNADRTISARFTAKQYTITLDNNNGSGVSPSSLTATYNLSTLSSSITNPTRSGYVFTGWYTTAAGGYLVIDKDGNLQENSPYTGAGGVWTNDGNVKLYAGWLQVHEPGTYKSTYDKDLTDVSGIGWERYLFGLSSSTWRIGASASLTSDGTSCVHKFNKSDGGTTDWIRSTPIDNNASSSMNIASTEYASCGSVYSMKLSSNAGQGLTFCVKGYSKFSIAAKDNNATKGNNKYIKVLVNGSDVTAGLSTTDPSRREYTLASPSTTYTIQLIAVGTNENKLWGFALQPAAPTISGTSMAGYTYNQGDEANTMTVTASPVVAGHTLTYTWYSNTVANTLTGATEVQSGSSSSYTPSTSTPGALYYVCVVSEAGCNTAQTAWSGLITVNAPSCSAPDAPTISGTADYIVGQTLTLTASCESGADASTTYTWYKGDTWGSKSQVQAAAVAGSNGNKYTKTAAVGDAGTYWCEASNGSGCEAHNSTGKAVTVVYKVTYNNNGGSGTISNSTGTSITLSNGTGFTAPDGYTFDGWNTAADGSGTGYTSGQTGVTANLDLYARWKQTVTIDDQGGSKDGSVVVYYNGTAGTPTAPTYAGHTPDLGYYAESGCTTKVMNLNGSLVSNVTDGSSVAWTNSSGKWIKTGSSKLYAHWKCDAPTITDNGDYTVSISVPSGTTVRYTTDGTTPSSSVGTEYSSAFTVASNCTVKAVAYQTGCTDSEMASRSITLCTPVFGSVTFDNNKSEKRDISYNTSTDVEVIGTATWTQSGVSSDTGHPMTKPAMKLDNTADYIKITLPSGITSGTITIQACTYSGDAGTLIINDEDNSTTPLASAEVGQKDSKAYYKVNSPDGDSWTAPTLKTLTYSSISAGGDFYIKKSSGANIYVYAFSATSESACPKPTITATRLTAEYMPTGSSGVQIGVAVTGASSGWKYRVKNKNGGYEAPDNNTYSTSTWTMTSTIGTGANTYKVELYDNSATPVKKAVSSVITVYGEVAYPMTISAGDGGSVSPTSASANGEHLNPTITATPSSGYHFVNWTLSNANATLDDATSAETTITSASGACTITANFAADCTKPGTPTRPTIEDGTLTHAGATFVWDPDGATANSDGYNVSIVKVSDGSTVLSWTSEGIGTEGGAAVYTATGLTGSTEYYFIVKAIGAAGYCSYGDTSRLTFTTLGAPYTITYHLNGASWVNEGAASYRHGTGYTLPVAGDMSNTGYTFDGWYDNVGLTGDAVTSIGSAETGNKEFWAKWTENTYTVTYDKNGGSGSTMDNTVGHYVTLSANTYTNSGYVFAGWNTAANGSGASYSEGEEIELKANLDLYAIWATDYTITWDAKAKLSGVAVTPNLGGGNYTITASVSAWTGSLDASMISSETSGVTITNVEVDNIASPKPITATFNVGASVVGESVTFELDVPAAGVYSAKSSTKNITIDRCTGSSSGSDGVLFSAEFKDSGLGTSDICTAANTDYTFTTSELKAAPTGGSIKASTTSTLSHMKFATNAISIAGSDGVIRIDLDNAIATNDLFTYVNVNSSSSSAYLRHTSADNTTDQIALTVYNSKESKVMLPAGFNGKTTLYIVRNSSNFNLHKAAVIRPAFLMLMRDDTPTESSTNLSGTDVALTTDDYLAVISGGSATFTSPASGNLKIKRNNSKNYINFNNAAGYIKVVLSEALAEGDVIGFDSYNTNNLDFTTTAEHTSVITTTNQLYTVNSSSALKGETTFYIWQHSGSSDYLRGLQIARSGVAGGSSGTDKITTTLTWDDDALDIAKDGVAKVTGDADFTFTASQDKNSLGAITYSSNNTSVATVNASGKVHIAGAGNATITATMAASGCYKEATVSYNITVTDNCADVAGTISTEDLDCLGVRLTVTGHTTSGKTVSYQWYKDGGAIGGATSDNYTATDAGEYYVVVTNTGDGHCAKASTNTITLEARAAATASKIVDQWYVKNGRRTPDIALVQTEGAESFIVKSGDSPITTFAGCAFYLGTDGIIYLKGQQEDGSAPTGLTSGDETLKFTATACGGNSSELSITIHKQESTTRPSVAFVVDGTKGGDFDEEEENHSVNTELYQYLDYGADETGAFDLTGQNVYSTVDEQAIREHYSQFDAILITDDPSTDTKSGKKSYVDAFGTMIDVRPILTMEAFVSKWPNWKAKGIDGNPESPNPRQYKMKLQCKDHAIFKDLSVGTNVETETIDGVEYWTVTMVDNTKSPYSGVADGTDTDTKPALQGFSADDVNSLLLLGQISGGSLYAGVERQEETAARLMLLGLNAKALPNALTPEGKKVIENALKYLIETDLEKVDDCSNYFTGATDTDWNKDSNWSKGHVPNSPNVRVRILSECVINSGTYKVAEVDIATSGKSLNKAGEMTGKLTINAGAALIVGGKIRTAEAPYFNTGDLKPTTEEDLVINTSSTAQAALIFDNEDGDTKATVSFYSLGRNDGAFKYQYIASPMEVVPVSESYHGSGVYTYVYTEAGGWERRGYYTDLYAFEGVAITTRSATATEYTVSGTLAHTNEREIDITVENGGDNMIGNSWTAPIQISELSKAPNTATLASSTVYVYCSGRDATLGTGASGSTEVAGQWLAVPFNAASFKDWTGLKVIPAMNAFEFLATAAGTITLNYDTLVRGGSQYDLTAKARAPKRIVAHEGIDLVRIRVADTKTHNDIHLFEGDVFSEAFDDGWEAKYMTGEGISAQLYAMNGEDKMAVLATSTLEGTVLGFAPGREREYTFSFLGADNGYYLNDLKLKTSTPISETEHYTFTYEEGDTNRFYISKTAIDAPQTPTGVDNTHSGEVKAKKFIYNDKMYIMINGRVYSAEGQIVK